MNRTPSRRSARDFNVPVHTLILSSFNAWRKDWRGWWRRASSARVSAMSSESSSSANIRVNTASRWRGRKVLKAVTKTSAAASMALIARNVAEATPNHKLKCLPGRFQADKLFNAHLGKRRSRRRTPDALAPDFVRFCRGGRLAECFPILQAFEKGSRSRSAAQAMELKAQRQSGFGIQFECEVAAIFQEFDARERGAESHLE